MRVRTNRPWKNPKTYEPIKVKRLSGYQQSIFILKRVYPVLHQVLTNAGAFESWQIKQLNPIYKNTLNLLEKLFTAKSLQHLSNYSPDLPSSIDVDSLVEIESWHWEDIAAFVDLIENKLSVQNRHFKLPESLKDNISKIKQIVSGKSLDDDIIKKLLINRKRKKPKVIIYKNGRVDYHSSSGKKHSSTFRTHSNAYKFLTVLASKPHKTLSFEEIGKALNEPKRNSSEPDNERRVRDTAAFIRKKMKAGKRFEFLKSDYGFGLHCIIQIKNTSK